MDDGIGKKIDTWIAIGVKLAPLIFIGFFVLWAMIIIFKRFI